MSIRSDKVSSVIKRALANPVSTISEECGAGLATVTAVRLSSDLQFAKIYISSYGGNMNPAEFIKILENKTGELRHIIGSSVRLRFTPDLKFYLDDTLDQMEHIQKLIDSVKNNKEDS